MGLLTLADAKAQLDIDTGDSDLELQAYVDSVTAVIERYVGPVEIRTVTERVNACDTRLALTQVPAVSLTSLTPVRPGGLAIAVADLDLDPDAGVLQRLDGGVFYGGPWTAVYQAGRGDVPPTINLAARILLQHLWRTQYGAARGTSGGGDDFDVTQPVPGFGYAVPNRVLQLLEAYRVPPGVA